MIINVAQQFSDAPAGRYLSDGPHSGEAFRERVLKPALAKGDRVIVQLDGVEGYGSSFLEEAFGGLVRLGYLNSQDFKKRLEIVSEDQSLVDEAWMYMEEAANLKVN